MLFGKEEKAFTIKRNLCSRRRETGVHDALKSAFTLSRNTHLLGM
jgi:hypothetical protein